LEQFRSENFLEDKKIFCVLREPYQRYLTGFVSFLFGPAVFDHNEISGRTIRKLIKYKDPRNDDILRLLFFFNQFNYDIHTELQSTSLIEFDISKIDFFYLNDKMGFQLNKYFESHKVNIPFNNEKVNARPDENFYKSLLKSFFEKEEHIMFKENLLNYLKPDYDLINSVNFYDT
jgi:hypothetical protein